MIENGQVEEDQPGGDSQQDNPGNTQRHPAEPSSCAPLVVRLVPALRAFFLFRQLSDLPGELPQRLFHRFWIMRVPTPPLALLPGFQRFAYLMSPLFHDSDLLLKFLNLSMTGAKLLLGLLLCLAEISDSAFESF